MARNIPHITAATLGSQGTAANARASAAQHASIRRNAGKRGWPRRAARSMEEEATAALHAAESRKQGVALMIQAEVDQALSELTAAGERVSISETNINQADLAVKNARLRYNAGSISNLDLLDAETAVAQARLTNLQALYDVVTGTIRLRRATGSPVAGQ